MERKSNKKTKKTSKLNWFTITRKYWKEQLIFYILTTLSCLGAFLITSNGSKFLYQAIKEGNSKNYSLKWDFNFFSKLFNDAAGNPPTWNFGDSYGKFLTAMLVIIVIACLIVIAHVWFSYYFANKIATATKKKLAHKLFALQNTHDRKKTLAVLTHNSRVFSYWSIFAPNQIYYMFLDTLMTFLAIREAAKKGEPALMWWGIGFYLLIMTIIITLQYFVYKKDQPFQKSLKKEIEREDFLVNKRDLIIKKNLTTSSLNSYDYYLTKTNQTANRRDFIYTLSWVVPSYSLVRMASFLFLPFAVKSSDMHFAVNKLVDLSDSTKKITERLRDYPYGLSAQKQINNFLAQPERNDRQKNILISEPIKNITLQKVSFGYEKKKLVLKKLDWEFQVGKINHLAGENGFGKSTIISLIMGLYQPHKGEILINNNYKLSEINLTKWREKIAYAEHENLIENGLSTGQKQLADLETLLTSSDKKEVFIFDEADNALDENNQKKFRQKIEKLAKKKLVILISH